MKGVASVASFLLTSTFVWAVPLPSASAQDCPTAQTSRHGFVVEREEKSKTEVFVGDDAIVRTIFRFDGKVLLETTQFKGLFQLDRLEQGRRMVFRPKANLSSLVPLKIGQKVDAEFDVEGAGEAATATVELFVKQQDTLYIGPCKYDVLKIERRDSRGGGTPRFLDTDYYSPALNLVIAKEYQDGGNPNDLIKFDRIYSIKQ